jgi:hypothetical protein
MTEPAGRAAPILVAAAIAAIVFLAIAIAVVVTTASVPDARALGTAVVSRG